MNSYTYLQLNDHHFELLGNLLICVNVTLILVSLLCCNNLLIKEPVSQNPFKLIYKVSKYAVKHRYLTSQRSAFTYADQEPIGRFDLGKSKYGGPFTTEEVEDVKTFYRLLPVIIGGGLVASGLLAVDDLDIFLKQRFVFPSIGNEIAKINNYVAANLIPSSYALLIMFYEILIYPVCWRCCPRVTSLHKFIIGGILQTTTFLPLMVFDILSRKNFLDQNGHNATVSCALYSDHQRLATKFNYNWIAIPNTLVVLSTLMMVIGFLEFISAQVPYSMKGVIFGVSFCSAIAAASLHAVVSIPFKRQLSIWGTGLISCEFWYALVYTLLGIFGCIICAVIINRYKKRKREDVLPNEHYYAERYYSNILEHRAA